jgi:hypothetical protein
MNERFTGYNTDTQRFDTIPTRGWSDPSRREAFEQHFGAPVGEYGYEFDASKYLQMLAVDTIADGVAAGMNTEFGDGANFRSVQHSQFENDDGTFSRGVILLGASNHEIAQRHQAEFARRINVALEALEANVRLGEHTE